MTPRRIQSRDEQGSVIGAVELVDGSVETVDELDAWADAFETDAVPPALAPPRRRPGRPSLDVEGESPRVMARVPQALIDRTDRAARGFGITRANVLRLALEEWLDQHDQKPAPVESGLVTVVDTNGDVVVVAAYPNGLGAVVGPSAQAPRGPRLHRQQRPAREPRE